MKKIQDYTTRKESKAEQLLRRKIQSSGESGGLNIKSKSNTFANRFMQLKDKIKTEASELKRQEQELESQRKYGFDTDLLPDFNFNSNTSANSKVKASSSTNKVNEKDPYSGKYLSTRNISPENLKTLFDGMKLMRIEHLLGKVTPPQFESPLAKYANYVVFGVICGKSEPKMTGSGGGGRFGNGVNHNNKNNNKKGRIIEDGSGGIVGGEGDSDDGIGEPATTAAQGAGRNNPIQNIRSKQTRSKYITLQITNFKQQIPLTLLSNAFHKYWKLQLGTIIAILNPTIFAYPDHTGFSLTLSQDNNCILELGQARDFAFCKAITKAGKRCGVPVELRKCDLCDFHAELQFKRTASKRAELDGSFRMFDPRGKDGRKQAMFVGGAGTGVGGGGKGRDGGGGKGSVGMGGQVVVDSFIPKYDRKKEASELYFSNADASRAFFNDQYQNPNFLTDIQNEKLARERKRKELQLKRSLGNLKGGEMLRDSTLASAETRRKMKKVSQTAFNASALGKIGFDPTKRMFEKKNDDAGIVVKSFKERFG
ncbi:unnamed protein product [Ambrosiozyma monospora]|uniref:Unnamed protein product n=1 Tax=Ambrosiozyma monospora TaxID=43982 RepID=A0ACB5TAY0_AMBMO|nr:unnamed protein product [Ambrosiozyma monospora]